MTFAARPVRPSGPIIQLSSPVTASFLSGGVSQAVTGYFVSTDGFVYKTAGPTLSYSQQEKWNSDAATVGNYEVRATVAAGTAPAGAALATWLACSTSRSWTLTSVITQTQSCDLTIEIRNATTLAVLATSTVSLISDAA